jgi:hypothetical protein
MLPGPQVASLWVVDPKPRKFLFLKGFSFDLERFARVRFLVAAGDSTYRATC